MTKTETYTYDKFNYVIRKPDNFDENSTYPTILFLHGAGTRGNDVKLLENNPFFKSANIDEFVVYAPQCNGNTWVSVFEQLKDFTSFVLSRNFVDNDKFYAIGASMGGYAVWELAMNMPEIFAAIIPICGGGMYWNAARLKNVPVWAFHGEDDSTVFCEESKKMVNAVNANGGKAKLTIYPDTAHDSWTATYQNKEVFKWLLSNKRLRTDIETDKYFDSKLYG